MDVWGNIQKGEPINPDIRDHTEINSIFYFILFCFVLFFFLIWN